MTYCALYSTKTGWGVYRYSKQVYECICKADNENLARKYAGNLNRNMVK